MKKISLKLTVLFLLISFVVQSQTNDNSNLLNELLEFEFDNVEKLYKDCMLNPCYGDSTYYTAWYIGLKAENDINLDLAIDNYLIALNFKRFELSSYEVKLSLGRAEIKKGNNEKGIQYLSEFICDAEKDINNEDSMWGLTEEGKKEINDKISFANRLIEKYK
jgi:hypothetical protein